RPSRDNSRGCGAFADARARGPGYDCRIADGSCDCDCALKIAAGSCGARLDATIMKCGATTLYGCPSRGSILFRQREDLARKNQVRIADLVLICLIDHGVFHPLAIDAAGNAPEAVTRLDKGAELAAGLREHHIARLRLLERQLNARDHLVLAVQLIDAERVVTGRERLIGDKRPV